MAKPNIKHASLQIPSWLAVLIQWTWGLPQTLLGFLVFLIVRIIDRTSFSFPSTNGTKLTRTTIIGAGLSLGFYIYSYNYDLYPVKIGPGVQERIDAHEWGHSIQSLIFGPLYLLVIGIPSVMRGSISHWHYNKNDNWDYYNGFPENWADKIGGVQRPKSRNKK